MYNYNLQHEDEISLLMWIIVLYSTSFIGFDSWLLWEIVQRFLISKHAWNHAAKILLVSSKEIVMQKIPIHSCFNKNKKIKNQPGFFQSMVMSGTGFFVGFLHCLNDNMAANNVPRTLSLSLIFFISSYNYILVF